MFPKFGNGRCFEGFDYHLGCAQIRCMLEAHGVSTSQFVHPGHHPIVALADLILASAPRVVGFSCYDVNYYFVKLLAEALKHRRPCLIIVCGGPSATFSGSRILDDCTAIDACVRSYAEHAAVPLWEWACGQRAIESIPGMTWRDGGTIRESAALSLREALGVVGGGKEPHRTNALDAFPDPWLEGMIPAARAADIGILTSRGCTFPCVYCNFSAMSQWKVNFHSVDRVIDVMRYLDKSLTRDDGQPTVISINDDNFSLHRRRFEDLLRRMARESFSNIRFWAEMRTETLSESTFSLMVDAGFTSVHFGLESGVPEILSSSRKVRAGGGEDDDFRMERAFLDRMRWAVRSAKEAGLVVNVSVIIGLPGESSEQGHRTIEFVKQLDVEGYAHNYLSILAGTELSSCHDILGISVVPVAGKALPTRTIAAYDVHSVPLLDNELVQSSADRAELLRAGLLLTGSRVPDLLCTQQRLLDGVLSHEIPLPEPGRASLPVVAVDDVDFESGMLDWLARELPPSASFWVIHSRPVTQAGFEAPLSEHGVPVLFANTLRRTNQDPWRVNEVSINSPDANTRCIHRLGWSALGGGDLPVGHNAVRDSVILAADSQSDVSDLVDWARHGMGTYSWSIPDEIVAARPMVADGCRWCSAPCPAPEGRRWFIAAQGSAKPCILGPSLGDPSVSFDGLRNHATEWLDAERERRDCAGCSAYSTCSTCPAQVPGVDFCTTRRDHPEIAPFIDGLMLIRALVHGGHASPGHGSWIVHALSPVLEGSFMKDGDGFPLAECVVVEQEGTDGGFIHHAKTCMLAGLDKAQTQIFVTLKELNI
ncbi:MAG: B12-binding domain-containing radical SAM protein [bacterium]|nr:B12-binding domain-containing radical SAM protein [bacterium]